MEGERESKKKRKIFRGISKIERVTMGERYRESKCEGQ